MKTTYQERPRKGGGTECILPESGRPREPWNGHTNSQWRRLLPIAFTAENAQKVHTGTKTQTRRLLNPQPCASDGQPYYDGALVAIRANDGLEHHSYNRWWPRYRDGDVLWVQEPWRTNKGLDDVKPTLLTTAAPIQHTGDPRRVDLCRDGKLRPGRFLPLRFARPARYEVVSVRCERVNEISEEDAMAEGCKPDNYTEAQKRSEYLGAVNRFSVLWNSIHGKQHGTRFADAPWCFAYTFKKL